MAQVELVCFECKEKYTAGSTKKCKDGNHRCKKCQQKISNKKTQPLRNKLQQTRYREKRYGISLESYLILWEKQGKVCSICKTPNETNEYFPVDHNHQTGKVRGILCPGCNRTLGVFKENIGILTSAVNYLIRTDFSRSWDHHFVSIASLIATRSKDPSTQVGAVIVKDKTILSTGYNGLPRNVNDDVPERWERPLKYDWVVHGEENAILNAVRIGVSVKDSILYVTPLSPCLKCAKAIIQSGIKQVVVNEPVENYRWTEETKKAASLLAASNVLVRKPE